MPSYKTVDTLSARPGAVADALKSVLEHAAPMGYAVSAVAISTGQLSITVSRTLTAAERSHLGLA